MDFNLAPLSMRRDIALLGPLHRSAIGEGPLQFRELFWRRRGSFKLDDPLESKRVSPLMCTTPWAVRFSAVQ